MAALQDAPDRCRRVRCLRRVGMLWSLLMLVSLTRAHGEEGKPGEHDCVIEPYQLVRLASPVVGVLARIDVDRGDIVRKGQTVAMLDDRVERATLALAREKAVQETTIRSAEARLNYIERKLERVAHLQSRSLKSLNDLQEAEAEKQVAEQLLREAQANRVLAQLEVQRATELLNQRYLRSPIDGIVVERLLVPGEYRNENSPILTLAEVDRLRVEVILPTTHFGQLQIGSEAEVRPDAAIGGVYRAVIDVIDRVHDAASGTFGVRLALSNADHALPSGIRCRIRFTIGRSRPE